MLTARLLSQGLAIDVISHPGQDHAMQDRWIVHERAHTMRIGVIDGCTPWRAENYPGGDAAAWAAQTAAHYFGLDLDLPDAADQAHTQLHNPALELSRQQSMTCAAVIDAQIERGQVDYRGIVVGDCELWSVARPGDKPLLVAGGQGLTDQALHEWLKNKKPQESREELREREAVAFNEPQAWQRPALGRFERPKYTQAQGRGHTIILSSDGAKLETAFKLGITPETLPGWIEQECAREDRDDITCAIIRIGEHESN